MAVKPLNAALCTACITLIGIDYLLLIARPDHANPRMAIAIMFAAAGAGSLAGLITVLINFVLGHRPRVRRKR